MSNWSTTSSEYELSSNWSDINATDDEELNLELSRMERAEQNAECAILDEEFDGPSSLAPPPPSYTPEVPVFVTRPPTPCPVSSTHDHLLPSLWDRACESSLHSIITRELESIYGRRWPFSVFTTFDQRGSNLVVSMQRPTDWVIPGPDSLIAEYIEVHLAILSNRFKFTLIWTPVWSIVPKCLTRNKTLNRKTLSSCYHFRKAKNSILNVIAFPWSVSSSSQILQPANILPNIFK